MEEKRKELEEAIMSDKEIEDLEIKAVNRYKGNNSTTERAMDRDYISMLKRLQEAYRARDGPKRRDKIGTTLTDMQRVEMLEEILSELEKERSAYFEAYFIPGTEAGL